MRTLACLFVVACSTPKPPPDKPMPKTASMLDCDQVAERVAAAVGAGKPQAHATHTAVKDMILNRCKSDAWSDDAKQCMHAITAIKDGRVCATRMSLPQRTALRKDASALRGASAPTAEPDDPSGDWIKHVVEEPGTPTR